MRRAILEALRARYEAEIAEADATANIYLENSRLICFTWMSYYSINQTIVFCLLST